MIADGYLGGTSASSVSDLHANILSALAGAAQAAVRAPLHLDAAAKGEAGLITGRARCSAVDGSMTPPHVDTLNVSCYL